METTMNAMVLEAQGGRLAYKELPLPCFGPEQVLIKVLACGICRTDLHIIDGELTKPKLPLIPGHEIIGKVARVGSEVTLLKEDDLVGVPWLGYTCGHCKYCCRQQENLCEKALFTGYTLDGGFAEYTVANQNFCFRLPATFEDPSRAPLLCAGLIGYRSYAMAGEKAENIGIYGFGAAAHILTQVAKQQGKKIFAFTRDGDTAAQAFAIRMGAAWSGGASAKAPVVLDAAIIFAPTGALIPTALRAIDKGCTVVCGGIHMSEIPSFPYDILWGERKLQSVANLTRKDGEDFLKIAAGINIHTDVRLFALQQANEAIDMLRRGDIQGAAVLVMR